MATLHVRNVPDQLYELLRRQAEANGRSIGAETVQLLYELLEAREEARARPRAEEPPFRVVDLGGDAADWEDTLNDATQDGYRVVAIVEGRAVLERLS